MPILTLVRHGQSIYNLENRFTGSLDIGLTPLGEKEAHEAGKKLCGIHYSTGYTSMLHRAQETMRIILAEINEADVPVVKTVALNERMYGSLQGMNKEETIERYGAEQVDLWRRSYHTRPPDGESLEDTYNRVIPFFKSDVEPGLRSQHNSIIVAHGNSLRALMMYLEKIDPVAIALVNILTGIPRNYHLKPNLEIEHVAYL